jgi:BlaI family penicillinase repressor
MRICWDKGKSSAKIIYEESLKSKKRSYVTVKTILDRLAKKGYLEREMFGPIVLYTPIISQKSATSHTIDDFIKTVMGDHVAPIFMHLFKKKKYRDEINKLKHIIDEMEEE